MGNIRLITGLFILALSSFFYLVYPSDTYDVNIIYVIGILIVLLQIALNNFFRLSLYKFITTSVLFFLGVKVLFFVIFMDFPTPLSVTTVLEILSLSLLLYFTFLFCKILTFVELNRERETRSSHHRKPDQSDEISIEIIKEINRCRRHDHSFSLIKVQIEASNYLNELESDTNKNHAENSIHLYNIISKIITDILRDSDTVIHHVKDDTIYIICPETSEQQSEIFIKRISSTLHNKLNIDSTMKKATFPHDAITLEELLTKLFTPST